MTAPYPTFFLSRDEILVLAKEAAARYRLPFPLIAAIIEQESGFNPYAIRFEPAFFHKYTEPMHLSDTEECARAFSWGLMQLMGESARELNFALPFPALCDPETNIELGCQWFLRKLAKASGDIATGLHLWNGGGNPHYAVEVLGRMNKYAERPTTVIEVVP